MGYLEKGEKVDKVTEEKVDKTDSTKTNSEEPKEKMVLTKEMAQALSKMIADVGNYNAKESCATKNKLHS